MSRSECEWPRIFLSSKGILLRLSSSSSNLSFYPLYPGFISKSESGEAQLSVKQMNYANLPCSPHLMLFASTHPAFASVRNFHFLYCVLRYRKLERQFV